MKTGQIEAGRTVTGFQSEEAIGKSAASFRDLNHAVERQLCAFGHMVRDFDVVDDIACD